MTPQGQFSPRTNETTQALLTTKVLPGHLMNSFGTISIPQGHLPNTVLNQGQQHMVYHPGGLSTYVSAPSSGLVLNTGSISQSVASNSGVPGNTSHTLSSGVLGTSGNVSPSFPEAGQTLSPVPMATPQTLVDQTWYVDFGATNHMTSDVNNLLIKDNYQGGFAVQVRNGQTLPVTHTCMSLLASNYSFRVLHLKQMLCATYSKELAQYFTNY